MNTRITKAYCSVYKDKYASEGANYLVGGKKNHFRDVHVLNFAYYDYPYISVLKECKYYLNNFGAISDTIKPGYAIVGKDGMHCGVINSEGNSFIHTNPTKGEVTVTPLSAANTYFHNGYVIKTVPCNCPHWWC